MTFKWINDNKETVTFIFLAVILIGIFWNIFNVERQEIITAFENQIISVQDNDKAKLLKYTTIEYTDDSESQDENEAYAGKRHTIITTTDNMDVLELQVRYNESNEVVLLNYSCGTFWPNVGAIILGAILAFLLMCLVCMLF